MLQVYDTYQQNRLNSELTNNNCVQYLPMTVYSAGMHVSACERVCARARARVCVCVWNYIQPGFNLLLHKCCCRLVFGF